MLLGKTQCRQVNSYRRFGNSLLAHPQDPYASIRTRLYISDDICLQTHKDSEHDIRSASSASDAGTVFITFPKPRPTDLTNYRYQRARSRKHETRTYIYLNQLSSHLVSYTARAKVHELTRSVHLTCHFRSGRLIIKYAVTRNHT